MRLKIISWLKRFLWTLIEQHLSNQKTIRHVKQSHSIGVADDIGHLASLVTSSLGTGLTFLAHKGSKFLS